MVSILVDDDLLIRNYAPEDAPALFRAIDGSRAHLRPFLSWIDSTTRAEHSQQFIQDSLYEQDRQEGLALGIFTQAQRQLIGGIGMHAWNHDLKKACIGYWICKEYEGQGIIHRSAGRFLDFLFTRIGLNKVEIHFVPDNHRSAAVAHRLGATVEGVLRQSHKCHGRLEDLVIAGILKSEWLARDTMGVP